MSRTNGIVGIYLPGASLESRQQYVSALTEALYNANFDVEEYNAPSFSCHILVAWVTEENISDLESAKSQGIKIIAFQNLPQYNCIADFYVGCDFKAVGRAQAEYILSKIEDDNLSRDIVTIWQGSYLAYLAGGEFILSEIFTGAYDYFCNYGACLSYDISGDTEEEFTDSLQNFIDQSEADKDYISAVMISMDGIAMRALNCIHNLSNNIIVTTFGSSGTGMVLEYFRAHSVHYMFVRPKFNDLAWMVVEAVNRLLDLDFDAVFDETTINNGYENIPALISDEFSFPDYLKYEYWDGEIYQPPEPPTPPVRLVSIEIINMPRKIEYYKYESFESTGMIVQANYSDGSSAVVNNYTVTPTIFTNTISNKVTISYGSLTTSFNVRLNDRNIQSITVEKVKNAYLHNTVLSSDDFIVTAHYNVGNTRLVTDFACSPAVLDTLGTQKVEITYFEDGINCNAEINITVIKKLLAIDIVQLPEKLMYNRGERVNRGGMIIKAIYSDNSQQVISNGKVNVSPASLKFENGDESKDITVNYIENGITAFATYTVYKKTGSSFDECEIFQEFGECGNGRINLSTGLFMFEISDFCGGSDVFPITISHIYNGGISDTINSYGVGNGWKLNFHQELACENGTWQYISADGKKYLFDSEFGQTNERSSVRNQKLGLDLFAISSGVIKLIDRKNSNYIFKNINGKYRLSEIHRLPSTYSNAIEAYSLYITYTGSKISLITAGKRFNGSRPSVIFNYSGELLSSLTYVDNGETVVTKYAYNGNNLVKIERQNSNVNIGYLAVTEFGYGDKNFTVTDKSSKNEFGEYKTLQYSLNNSLKVVKFSDGYGATGRDETNIVYTSDAIIQNESVSKTDIVLSAVLTNKKTVTVYSFNQMGLSSQSCYEIGTTNIVKKVNYAISRGFDYVSLANTYSDTLDIAHDNFEENSVCGWSGGTLNSAFAINGTASLSGSRLSKTFMLNGLKSETTLYLSLWASVNQNATVTIEVRGSGGNIVFTQALDGKTSKWQFAAFCLGKRKVGESISVTVSGYSILLCDVRLTKSPYEIPDDKS